MAEPAGKKPKNNTCQPSSIQKRLTRQLEGIQKHLENFPDDKLSQARAATIRSQLGAQ
jgi:hypothetical protein